MAPLRPMEAGGASQGLHASPYSSFKRCSQLSVQLTSASLESRSLANQNARGANSLERRLDCELSVQLRDSAPN